MSSLFDAIIGHPATQAVLGGLGYAGNLVDTYSGASSLRDLLSGDNPWDQFLDPQNADKRVTGRQMLENRGLADANEDQGWVPDAGDLGGFAAEMLLDPTNLIGGGLAAKLMGKASKAKAANKGIEAANAVSREQRAMGFMPEEVAKLTKIVDETGAPKKMYHGTPHVFDKFDADKLDPAALYGNGIYTTDSPRIASEYSSKGEVDAIQKALESDSRLTDLRRRKSIARREAKKSGSLHDDARHNRAWDLSDRIDEKLSDRADRISGDAVARNVRQHFIDARNPIDMDGFLDNNAPVLREALEKRIGEPDTWTDWGSLRDDALDSVGPSSTGSAAWQALRGTGENVNDILRESGFDAITHRGGGNTGGATHNVTIALDPSQVYLPYIAKELQEMQRVASPNSLLMALAGTNAVHRHLSRND